MVVAGNGRQRRWFWAGVGWRGRVAAGGGAVAMRNVLLSSCVNGYGRIRMPWLLNFFIYFFHFSLFLKVFGFFLSCHVL